MTAPTLDGTANNIATNSLTYTVTLTTANANDIICVLVYTESGSSGTAPAITSVTASGLTFVQRARSHASNKGSIELWWALASSALSSKVITITFPSGYDDSACIAFGVSGCYTSAPWDNNSSVPKYLSNTQSPSFTGISTTESNDFLLFCCGSNAGWTSIGTVPTGFTAVAFRENAGGSLYASVGAAYKGVTSPQSSATFAWGSTITNGQSANEYIFDALTADAPVVPSSARPQVFAAT